MDAKIGPIWRLDGRSSPTRHAYEIYQNLWIGDLRSPAGTPIVEAGRPEAVHGEVRRMFTFAAFFGRSRGRGGNGQPPKY